MSYMFRYLVAAQPILTPLLSILLAEVGFLRILKRRDGELQAFELGVFSSGLVIIYSIFPSIGYLANGLSVPFYGDPRLLVDQPSPSDLAPIYWYYALYFISFVTAYALYRGRYRIQKRVDLKTDPKILPILIVVYVLIWLFFVCLRTFWNVQAATSYAESYLIYRGLPLILQQFANHLTGIGLTLQLALMVYLTANYRRHKMAIWLWFLGELVSTFVFGIGARSGLMILVLSMVITYHFAIKRIPLRTITLFCTAGLVLFLGLGILRDLANDSNSAVNLLTAPNEFTSIFGNAYDLRQLKASGQTEELIPRLYFADFMNLFPQQIVPFQKIDVADWYVHTFYPVSADLGYGFAFGTISEAVVGSGWFDVIWRGAVVGLVFAYIHRCFVRNRTTFWGFTFYLWVVILSYQMFRGTTFILVPRAMYDFVILMWVTGLIARYLTAPRRSPGINVPSANPSGTTPI